MRKKAGQTVTSVAVPSDGRPAAVMVHYSLFMVLCLNVMLFRVSRDVCARVMRARVRFLAFSYCTVQYESNKISRFYALTPKIMYSDPLGAKAVSLK